MAQQWYRPSMEPIERELKDRKDRLKRMAMELQKLEAIRPLPSPPMDLDWFMKHDAHDRKIVELQSRIGQARAGIEELEEIIAEGRTPAKLGKPDVSQRRKLSDEEQDRIASKIRAEFWHGQPHADDVEVEIRVERLTDLEGYPIVSVLSSLKRTKPLRDS